MIAPIGPDAVAALNAATAARGSAVLDQSSFLRLMTTQLQTQDPLQPMDSKDMVAQMAQFSNVAGITEMNATLRAIAARLGGADAGSDASGWIGRDVLIAGEVAYPATDGRYRGQVLLDRPVATMTIDLLDTSGLIVHTETATATDGPVPFDFGNVRGGPLRVRVSARDADGAVATTTNIWSAVQAVQSPARGAEQRLVTPNGLIAPATAIRLG